MNVGGIGAGGMSAGAGLPTGGQSLQSAASGSSSENLQTMTNEASRTGSGFNVGDTVGYNNSRGQLVTGTFQGEQNGIGQMTDSMGQMHSQPMMMLMIISSKKDDEEDEDRTTIIMAGDPNAMQNGMNTMLNAMNAMNNDMATQGMMNAIMGNNYANTMYQQAADQVGPSATLPPEHSTPYAGPQMSGSGAAAAYGAGQAAGGSGASGGGAAPAGGGGAAAG